MTTRALNTVLFLVLSTVAGCTSARAVEENAASEALSGAQTVTLDPNGQSEAVRFDIPVGTRSVMVIAEGDPRSLFALSSLRVGGTDVIDLATTASLGSQMETAYFIQQSGRMPGRLTQSIRLGTFTQLYPDAPDQVLSPGPASLRIVSNARGATVRLKIVLTPDNGASKLHLNLVYATSRGRPSTELEGAFQTELARILAQASIEPIFDEISAPALASRIVTSTEPQEAPDSETTALAQAAHRTTRTKALPLVIVDQLPAGIGGLALGTPGPADPDAIYYGVVVRRSSSAAEQARVAAHELCHFLALQHVVNHDTSGAVIPDPIPNTIEGEGNLMASGTGSTRLTVGQATVLRKSPLLTLE